MSQQIQITGGAKVRDLQDVIIGTSGVLSSVAFNVANGVPKLDVNGKILVSQLPNSVMEYKGVWNAATNSPTLTNGGAFNQGDVYLCDTAGTVNFGSGSPISFIVGDQAIYSGSVWQKAGGATGTVTSVGLSTNAGAITIGNSPISTSGTITANFNGTNLQYVNGAGNLTTFPILTGYVTAVSGTAPVVSSGGTTPAISMAAATSSVDGYLTSADFTTFNNKQNAITLTTTGTSGASTLVGATLNIPNYGSALTGYVPYTGATTNVDLGTFNLTADVITGATGSFASNGGSDTFAINHSSGAGIALNITKGGNGEGLYINKTSGSGNAATIIGTLNATTLVKSGGTSSQFLKADGTVDSSTYALDSAVVHNTGNETVGGTKTFSDATKNNGGIFLQNASSNSLAGYMNLGGLTNGVKFTSGGGISNSFTLPSATGYTFTFPNATGTIALTSDLTGYLTAVTATSPLSSSGGTTPNITIAQATTSTNGYLSSTDWNTFNLKQPQLNGTGFVKASGTTISYDNSTYALDSAVVHLAGTETITGAKTFSTFTKFDGGVILKNNVSASLAGYVGLSAYSASGNKGINIDFDTYSNSFYFSGTLPYQYTFPAATGTIALVGGSGVGTVTSVAALTIGTSGTDLSSSVANSTTTPVITLNVPTASATNRGALASADWSTFNNKQGTITLTTTGTSGAATFSSNTLNIPNYGSALSAYLPLAGGTLTGALSGTSATFSSSVTATQGNFINAASNFPLTIDNSTQGYVAQVFKSNNVTFGYIGNANTLNSGGSNTDMVIRSENALILSSSSAERMRIWQTTGNVNIGTTPASDSGYKLDVNGTGRFSGNSGTPVSLAISTANSNCDVTMQSSNSSSVSRIRNGTNDLQFHTNGTLGLTLASNQAATFSSSVEAGGGFISNNDSNTPVGFYKLKPSSVTTARWWRITSDNVVYGDFSIAQSAANSDASYSNKLYFNATGAATFSSSVTATGFFESSDSRLKTLIKDNYQTKGIASITPKLYTKNGKVELGYYAQDFVGILDSAVSKGSDDMLSLSYREVHTAKIYALEQEIKELKAKMN
jgi:hypothetical protein